MAKGLAIILVVFGHIVARQDPAQVHWYEPLRRAIYAFHMPFFLYLSGFVAAASGFLGRGRAGFGAALQERAQRLLLPFFALGLLILAGKLVAARFIAVDNTPPSLTAGLAGLFWHTAASPALSVWYLFVLFVLVLATRWALDGQIERLANLLALALLAYWLPVPGYLYADRLTGYAPFFLLGALAGFARASWERCLTRLWRPALLCLLAGLSVVALWGQDWPQPFYMLPLGVISMPALHGAMRALRAQRAQRARAALLVLGRASFAIYLGNTICIGLAKGMMLRLGSWNGPHFLLFAPALMAAGLFGPILCRAAWLLIQDHGWPPLPPRMRHGHEHHS